ncbi:MAG: HrgA protein [Pseudomonadota bacterium]
MSKSKTTLDVILATLRQREGTRLTANELSAKMVEENPEWAEKKRSKSRNPAIRDGGFEELRAHVQSEIGSHRTRIENHETLRMTEDRPRRYYYSKLSDSEELEAVETSTDLGGQSASISEHDLYPLLAGFLRNEHGVYTRRIDERKSRNTQGSGGNRWLHPDLIGFEVVSERWSETIQQLVHSRSDPSSRLWSFEVKKLINRANLREVFFQTLSNSAWANLAYLVTREITGKGTLDELRILSSQHGVGLIQLDADFPEESVFLIQAEERAEVDWTAANRLSEENPDAEAVFRQVRVYHQAGELTKEFWD